MGRRADAREARNEECSDLMRLMGRGVWEPLLGHFSVVQLWRMKCVSNCKLAKKIWTITGIGRPEITPYFGVAINDFLKIFGHIQGTCPSAYISWHEPA